jgi:hypothetical protein
MTNASHCAERSRATPIRVSCAFYRPIAVAIMRNGFLRTQRSEQMQIQFSNTGCADLADVILEL